MYTVTVLISYQSLYNNIDGLYHFYIVTFCVWVSLFIEVYMYIKNTVMVGPDKPAIPGQRLFLAC